MIRQLKSQPESQKAGTAMVPTGGSLPALPRKRVEKILAAKFIDLADLPPAKGKVKPSLVQLKARLWWCKQRT